MQENSKSLRKRLIEEALDGYGFRFATPEDTEALAFLFEAACNESGFPSRGIRYSVSKAEAWLRDVIIRGSCPHLLATRGDEIIGAISYALDGTFCVDPVAVMHMLYIKPGHRRSAVGRMLVGLIADAARSDGAVAFHAPIAAEVREQSLINLFVHAGFTTIGTIMGRRL